MSRLDFAAAAQALTARADLSDTGRWVGLEILLYRRNGTGNGRRWVGLDALTATGHRPPIATAEGAVELAVAGLLETSRDSGGRLLVAIDRRALLSETEAESDEADACSTLPLPAHRQTRAAP